MDPDFFDCFTDLTWDLPIWTALVERTQGPVLELGCGSGRVLQHLHARGLEAWGVEQDPLLAERASRHAVQVWCADIETFRAPKPFPLVILPCNTVSLFEDPARLLRSCRANLLPGGQLVFDRVGHAHRPWAAPPYRWSRQRGELAEGGRFDPTTRRHQGWMRWRGQSTTRSTWYRSSAEWAHLLQEAGFSSHQSFDRTGTPCESDTWMLTLAS